MRTLFLRLSCLVFFLHHLADSLTVSPNLNRSRAPTFGVIIRIFKHELPYITSFIEHYSRIGVSSMTCLCTVLEDCDEIENYIKEKVHVTSEMAVSMVPYGDIRWDCLTRVYGRQHHCPEISKDILENMNEDFIMPVDPDEFLDLPPGNKSLADVVNSFPETALFRFRWIMVPFDGLGDAPELPYRGYSAPCKKYMVRTNAIKAISTHIPELNCEGENNCDTTVFGPSMYHFHYRGLADSLLKDSNSNFKASGEEYMLQLLQQGEPALRMKLMAFSAIVAEKLGPAIMVKQPLMRIDKAYENTLIASYNISLDHAMETYLRFKKALAHEANWNRFAKYAGQAPVEYEAELNQTTTASLEEHANATAYYAIDPTPALEIKGWLFD